MTIQGRKIRRSETEQIAFRRKQANLALNYLGDLSGMGRTLAENIIKCYPTIEHGRNEKRMAAAVAHGKTSLGLSPTQYRAMITELQKAISRAMAALHKAFDELNSR